jgi:hypothetical protein
MAAVVSTGLLRGRLCLCVVFNSWKELSGARFGEFIGAGPVGFCCWQQ